LINTQMQLQPPPQKFLSTLLEVRDYYAPLVDKYGKLYREALENLNHIEALLSNWSLTLDVDSHDSKGKVSDELFTLSAQKSLNNNSIEVSEPKPELLSKAAELPQVNNGTKENVSSQDKEENQPVAFAEENLSNGNSKDIPQTEAKSDEFNADELSATNQGTTATQENISLDDSDNIAETASELVQPSTTESSIAEDEPPAAKSTSKEQANQTPNKSLMGQDIPMLGEYQSLRRIEAVEKLLKNHKGSVCHIDFVVRSLYGELEPKTWKVVKGRVQSTLTQGRESGKWSLVPGKPGYYTIDLKLLNAPRKEASSKETKSNTNNKKPDPQAKTNSIPLKGEFEGKFLIDAITSLLQKNPKKIFDVAEVVKKLYGELKPEQVQKVRSGVLNELSRGYRTGRFSKVPQEKGLYIWDSKLLPDISRK
jgi:hypothetical protein